MRDAPVMFARILASAAVLAFGVAVAVAAGRSGWPGNRPNLRNTGEAAAYGLGPDRFSGRRNPGEAGGAGLGTALPPGTRLVQSLRKEKGMEMLFLEGPDEGGFPTDFHIEEMRKKGWVHDEAWIRACVDKDVPPVLMFSRAGSECMVGFQKENGKLLTTLLIRCTP